VLRSYRPLARLAFLMSGDPVTAEDMVAEAFARAWIPWKKGTVDTLEPYVRRVVVNLCVQGKRRRFLDWRRDQRLLVAGAPLTHAMGEQATDYIDLLRSLKALSADHRAVIVLRFYADLSEQETAEVLRLPVGTVKSRTSRALKVLRPLVERTGDE
jgi:RNA polymerase sigma factor (sigma-70 family)